MASLEQLCRPLVREVCLYWYNTRAGARYDLDTVRRDLRDKLATIRENVEDDPALKRNFTRIERPLVFFIDYTIKEGGFDFSSCWQELARDYDELSGDDKFFDMLSETLDDPDASEQLMMYYLFMGLGFDGAHSDRDFVERRMKVCATRFRDSTDLIPKALVPEDVMKKTKFRINRPHRFWNVYTLMITLSLLMILAGFYNFWVFRRCTSDYKNALDQAYEKSSWFGFGERKQFYAGPGRNGDPSQKNTESKQDK